MPLPLSLLIILITTISWVQGIEGLKLTDADIPRDYIKLNEIISESRAATYYKRTDVYSSMLGEVVKKDFQSFTSKKDSGTIFYFEYRNKFDAEEYLKGVLIGDDAPSKARLTEYLIKDNILIVWRFSKKSSKLKSISKEKIKSLINTRTIPTE